MNMHERNLDRDQFLVILTDGTAMVCATRDETEHEIASTDYGSGPDDAIVVWFNPVEGWSRDVSAEFGPSDDDDDDATGIPSPDSLRRWHEGRVL